VVFACVCVCVCLQAVGVCTYTTTSTNQMRAKKTRDSCVMAIFVLFILFCKIKSTWCIYNDDFISDSMLIN